MEQYTIMPCIEFAKFLAKVFQKLLGTFPLNLVIINVWNN